MDGGTGLVGSISRGRQRSDREVPRPTVRTAADVRVVAKGGKVSIDVGFGAGRAKVYLVGCAREQVTAIGRIDNRGRNHAGVENSAVDPYRPRIGAVRRSTSNSRFRSGRKSPASSSPHVFSSAKLSATNASSVASWASCDDRPEAARNFDHRAGSGRTAIDGLDYTHVSSSLSGGKLHQFRCKCAAGAVARTVPGRDSHSMRILANC